jgi:hypothetical protein
MIHWSWLVEASRSRSSDGMATLRMVLSSPITIKQRHSTPSAHHRRRLIVLASIVGPSSSFPSTAAMPLRPDVDPVQSDTIETTLFRNTDVS